MDSALAHEYKIKSVMVTVLHVQLFHLELCFAFQGYLVVIIIFPCVYLLFQVPKFPGTNKYLSSRISADQQCILNAYFIILRSSVKSLIG